MKTIHINNQGLFLDPNPYLVPDGSLVKAQNVNIEDKGVIKSRKGFEIVRSNIDLQDDEVFINLVSFASHYVVFTNKRYLYITHDGKQIHAGSNIESTSIDHFIFFNHLFFISKQGLYKMSPTFEVLPLGVPTPLRPNISLVTPANSAAATATLPPNKQVIYRITYRERDTSIRSAPSFPVRVTNDSSVAKNPSLQIVHPHGITSRHEVEIYRSHAVDTSDDLLADDELFRVKVLSLSGAPSLNFVDVGNPDEIPLYTNAFVEGIENSNYPPPYAASMCLHKGIACYANVTKKASIPFRMKPLSLTGGRLQITNGIDNIDIEAGYNEDIRRGIFRINDAKSMKNVIQQHRSNTFLNVYDIQVEDANEPTVLLESTRHHQDFRIVSLDNRNSDRALITSLSLDAPLPLKVTPRHCSSRIYFSKYEEPHAVPLYRYFSIGRSDKAIIKVISFRDTLFVFKEDGLFKIDGISFGHFTVSNFIKDLLLICENSVTILEDQVYCFSNYGFIRISDHGYEQIATPVENSLIEQLSQGRLFDSSFSVAMKHEKKYLFFYKRSSQRQASACYVYHSATKQWTEWVKRAQIGSLDDDDHLLLLDYHQKTLIKERHSATPYDCRDESYSVTVRPDDQRHLNHFTVKKQSHFPFSIKEGLFISQGLSYSCIDQIVSESDSHITFMTKDALTVDTSQQVEISKPINVLIRYNRLFFDDPTRLKKADKITFLLGPSFQKRLLAHFKTDISTYKQTTCLFTKQGIPFGSSEWGSAGFGGNQPSSQNLKTFAPRNKNIFHWIEIGFENNEIFSFICIFGLSIEYNYVHTNTL